MKRHDQDPRLWLAYVLGEISPDERYYLEAELREAPGEAEILRVVVDGVRQWARESDGDAPLLAFLAKATGDAQAAEDLRHEVFFRVSLYRVPGDGGSSPSTWLYRIACDALSTWQKERFRRRAAGQRTLGHIDVDESCTPYDFAAPDEPCGRVRSALARLEPTQRQLLLLRFDRDLSYREIAEIQGASETTVKSRVYAVLEKLRESFIEQTVSARSANQ